MTRQSERDIIEPPYFETFQGFDQDQLQYSPKHHYNNQYEVKSMTCKCYKSPLPTYIVLALIYSPSSFTFLWDSSNEIVFEHQSKKGG